MSVKSIFHINLNCSDLERSLEFYEALGFESRFTLEHDGVAGPEHTVHGIPEGRLEYEARLLVAGGDLYQTRIDLMQFKQPLAEVGEPLGATGLGLRRIALRVTDLQGMYEELRSKGFEFITEPVGPLPDLFVKWVVSLLDPDGVIVELMELMPGSKKNLYE